MLRSSLGKNSPVWLLACWTVLLPLWPAYADVRDNFLTLKPSVLFVTATTVSGGDTTVETGTGFILTASGYALTANHVVRPPNAKIEVSIGSRYGPKIAADVVPSGQEYADIALLKLPTSLGPYHPVEFGDWSKITPVSTLMAIGFPLQADISPSVGVYAGDGPAGSWQVQVPLSYGNSGGPIADDTGRVVGMVKGGVAGAQLINYALPLNRLAPVLNIVGITWPPFDSDNPAPVHRFNFRPVDVAPVPSLATTSKRHVLQAAEMIIPPDCHEVTAIAAGLPPTYTRTLECNR